MKLNKKEIKKTFIKSNSTIKDAINSLNKSGLKICLILNKKNKFVGTVVDGDIRRGLLNKLQLDSRIDQIVFRQPRVVNSKTSVYEAEEIMRVNYLNVLPIVDKDSTPIGLHTSDKIMRSRERENKFVIMAGGLGKRLLPLTKKKPKALIPVFDEPMLKHVILRAKKCGFRNFVISINYLGSMIKDHFSSGKKLDSNISYIEEKFFLGTAGSLCYLKSLKNESIIVTNCDIISDIDYSDALDYHRTNKADATMVVRRYEIKNPFGVIETKKNNFISYKEKPIKYENINAGIYIIESKVLKYIDHEVPLDMPEFFEKLVVKKKRVIVYPIHESWQDLGQKNNFS